MVFKKILVGLDNSSFSEGCCGAAVELARAFGAEVVGCHAYAAGLHRRRFRQMEATLPEEYLGDAALQRQRAIHSKLIDLGLRLISESYLDSLAQRCAAANVPFAKKTFDGRNWLRLVEEVNGSEYDLVVLGARGHGTSRADTVGSVCLRLLRHTRTDCLVIKDTGAWEDGRDRPIVVAIDGSQEAFGALRVAVALGKAFRRPVEAVAAYDPGFHYAVFRNMVQVLSQEAAKVFRYQEQERLHEQIIDRGLGRLYQTHLEVARRMAEAEGTALQTSLLAGRAADEILVYAERTKPWLLLLGRIGVHSGDELDMGSVTEHVLRFAQCNLLVGSRRHSPPASLWGADLRWTREAQSAMERLPQEYRQPVEIVAQRLALEGGHTVVTSSLLGEALADLGPRPEEQRPLGEAALAVAVESLRRQAGPAYLCQECAHVARGMPATCPGCGQDGGIFLALDDILDRLQPSDNR
ncbi:MAG: universal stress protein [Chloroflexi bacterium]|nr:universal stress protein [Chloroflexota bacterium]